MSSTPLSKRSTGGGGDVLAKPQLSDVLGEFARTMLTDLPIQAILDRLVERIIDVIPVAAAGVTLSSPGSNPRYVAASDDAALRYETLQSELGEGPCIEAFGTGAAVAVPDLRSDERFPSFARRALDAGLAAVFAFPLRHGAEQLGALDLYADEVGLLDAATMAAGQTLADVAAAYLLNAQARTALGDLAARSQETALHDALTGLPNRLLLLELIDHAIHRARRGRGIVAALFVDLDRFKLVNDLYGHRVGDELLVAVARRLSAAVRPGDTVARLSGDEFVIVCGELDDSQAETVAGRIVARLAEPFLLSDLELAVKASVGIAFARRDDHNAEQLLHDADAAMYRAKRRGGARHEIFDARQQHEVDRRVRLIRDLRGAVAREELRVEYQPIVQAEDGRITGVEALLRWDHPTWARVPVEDVVLLAERSGMIGEIGRWILERSCTELQRWSSRGWTDFTLSVNVSSRQLMSSGFVATVADVLAGTGTEPRRLTLEITESQNVEDLDGALVVLDALKALGVTLALDDFGTGWSSLYYLQHLPVDIVKIDRGFIGDLGSGRKDSAIVAAVIDLSHALGLTVVVEGVETLDQYHDLLALGCDSCQGYLFSRPVPAEEIDMLLKAPLIGLGSTHAGGPPDGVGGPSLEEVTSPSPSTARVPLVVPVVRHDLGGDDLVSIPSLSVDAGRSAPMLGIPPALRSRPARRRSSKAVTGTGPPPVGPGTREEQNEMASEHGALESLAVTVSFIGGRSLVAVRGEVDVASAPQLGAILDAVVQIGHPELVLDLAGMAFMDAAGLRVIASAAARLPRAAGGLTIRSPSALVARMLDITGLAKAVRFEAGGAAAPNLGAEQSDAVPGLPVRIDSADLGRNLRRVTSIPADDDVVDGALRLVVALARATVGGADGVSVSLRRHGRLSTVAASDQTISDMDCDQYATGEGPCVDASVEGRWFHVRSLGDEVRWPSFTPRARKLGIHAILSTPLLAGDHPVGALNIYSRTANAFAPEQQELASIFASEASIILRDAGVDVSEDQLSARFAEALLAREVIAHATGVIMQRDGVDSDAAQAILRRSSKQTGTPLKHLAADVVRAARPVPTGP
ncbi:MAG: anti-sigma factor antagonist [Acidimicrobiales bacterium]